MIAIGESVPVIVILIICTVLQLQKFNIFQYIINFIDYWQVSTYACTKSNNVALVHVYTEHFVTCFKRMQEDKTMVCQFLCVGLTYS